MLATRSSRRGAGSRPPTPPASSTAISSPATSSCRDDRVVVVDFGLARAADDDPEPESADEPATILDVNLTLTGERVGTLRYMAPEQHAGRGITAQADQFAFAAALWQALHEGRPPFQGATSAELLEDMQRVLPVAPQRKKTPPHVRAALARALAFRPEDRWPRLADLLDELASDPAARRRRVLGALLLATAAIAAPLAFVAGRQAPAAGDVCGAGERARAAVWDEAARGRVRAAFAATGAATAGESFARVDAGLGRKVAAWAAAYRDACEATHVRRAQSETLLDLRMACLDRARGEVEAFVATAGAGIDVEAMGRAVTAAGRSLDLAPCRDTQALRAATPPPSDPDAARAVSELRVEIDRLQAASELDRVAAVQTARALLPRARAVGFAPLLARALLIAGQLELGAGDPETGIDLLYDAARVAGEAHDDRTVAVALTALIIPLGTTRGRIDEAARVVTLAKGAMARAGNPRELLGALFHRVGSFHGFGRRDWISALAWYHLALAVLQPLPERGDVDAGFIAGSLGIAAYELGRPAEAVAYYRRALEIIFARLGPDHPSASVLVNNLGGVEQDLGNYEAAARLFRNSLASTERHFGPDSQHIVAPASNLAAVLLLTGELGEARAAAEHSLRVAERAYGRDNPKLADWLTVAATIAAQQGRYEEALAWSERAVALVETALGRENRALLTNLFGLSETQLAAGRTAAARATADRAVALAGALGEPPITLATALWHQGNALTGERRHAEAVAAYERALAVAEKAKGAEHPVVALVLSSAVEGNIGNRAPRRALELAERGHGLAARLGPYVLAQAELALARAIVAAGGDAARAVALARSARARLLGKGYVHRLRDIDAWLAQRR